MKMYPTGQVTGLFWPLVTVEQLSIYFLCLKIIRTTTKIHIRLNINRALSSTLHPIIIIIKNYSTSVQGGDSLGIQTYFQRYEALDFLSQHAVLQSSSVAQFIDIFTMYK